MVGFWLSKPICWLKFGSILGPNMNFEYPRVSLGGDKHTFWGYYTFSTPCSNKVLRVHCGAMGWYNYWKSILIFVCLQFLLATNESKIPCKTEQIFEILIKKWFNPIVIGKSQGGVKFEDCFLMIRLILLNWLCWNGFTVKVCEFGTG